MKKEVIEKYNWLPVLELLVELGCEYNWLFLIHVGKGSPGNDILEVLLGWPKIVPEPLIFIDFE